MKEHIVVFIKTWKLASNKIRNYENLMEGILRLTRITPGCRYVRVLSPLHEPKKGPDLATLFTLQFPKKITDSSCSRIRLVALSTFPLRQKSFSKILLSADKADPRSIPRRTPGAPRHAKCHAPCPARPDS